MELNTTENYNGNPVDIETGGGVVLVDYFVGVPDPDNPGELKATEPGVSALTLWVRKASTDIPFKRVREDTKPTAYRFEATGWDYYFTWEIKVPVPGLTCLLDAA